MHQEAARSLQLPSPHGQALGQHDRTDEVTNTTLKTEDVTKKVLRLTGEVVGGNLGGLFGAFGGFFASAALRSKKPLVFAFVGSVIGSAFGSKCGKAAFTAQKGNFAYPKV